MGSCLSSSKPQTPSKNVRVVHLNGFVEDFEHPISVGQLITSKPPKHFICTPSQLLSPLSKPLHSSVQLEPGTLYFMLPYSMLQPDVSPTNLVGLTRQLTKKANSHKPETRCVSPSSSPLCQSPMRSFSPMRSPSPNHRLCDKDAMGSPGYASQLSTRNWRPVLDTITERSFRSMSDLKEKYS